jgi:hypothetical protein
MAQETVEQRDVAARPERQEQIGDIARRRAARIDDDDLELRIARLCRAHALEQHGVAPREVRADEHDQLGVL